MKKIWTKYNGALLLYSVIIFGVFAINYRFKNLNTIEINEERSYKLVAMGD